MPALDARAGRIWMTSEASGENRCREVHATGNLGEPVTWERCNLPPFGLADLETEGVPPFPLCFRHLIRVAESADYIPIRPFNTIPVDYAGESNRQHVDTRHETCPDCGAVEYGNALCETCRSHWPGGDPVLKGRPPTATERSPDDRRTIFERLTEATRRADELHQNRVGGGTRHWVRECFLPSLIGQRLEVVDADLIWELESLLQEIARRGMDSVGDPLMLRVRRGLHLLIRRGEDEC